MNLRQLNRILLRMLWLPIFVLLLLSGILVGQILSAVRLVGKAQLADRNIALATSLNALIVDEETGLRGYQITGNRIFLQPYEFANAPLQQAFAELRSGIVQQHGDPRVIDRLASDHAAWKTMIALPLITATDRGAGTSGSDINMRGKAHMDNIRFQIRQIVSNERALRDAALSRFHQDVTHTIEVAVGLALVIGLMLGTFSRSQLHAVMAAFENTLATVRRHSQEVYASEQRLRTILTSIGDAVLVCDIEGRVEMLNPIAELLTGWTQNEALRRPIGEVLRLIHETTRQPLETPVDAVLRHNRPVPLAEHAVLLRRDGAELLIDDSGAPLRDATGKLSGVVVVFRDITEQRRTQAALLASEKVAISGRLAATIAHEIHNPLDAAINLLYLLRNDPSPEEAREFLEMASTELDRVARISRSMLSMYRESKQPVVVDLTAVLESLMLLLERQFRQARVELVGELEPNARVTGYPAELRQVFMNLLTNALDASPPDASVTVMLRADRSDGPGATVTIADQGPGIEPETMARLFQPFFTTKGEQGTGLGLWVSKGILDKHHGTIVMDNGPDGGTVVTVELPFDEESAQASASLPNTMPSASPATQS